jgi:hypothetical protein
VTPSQAVLLVPRCRVVRLFSPEQDVGGVKRGSAVVVVERPAPGKVAEDRLVAEAVTQEHLGSNDRRGISTHTPCIGREHGALNWTVRG